MDVIKRKIVSLRDQVEELEEEYSKVCQEVEEKKAAREKASIFLMSVESLRIATLTILEYFSIIMNFICEVHSLFYKSMLHMLW